MVGGGSRVSGNGCTLQRPGIAFREDPKDQLEVSAEEMRGEKPSADPRSSGVADRLREPQVADQRGHDIAERLEVGRVDQ
jgi:hypothetical protein